MIAVSNLSVLLLAAGSSSRMGQSKQLLSVDGKTLLRKMAEVALDVKADRVIVVLGANETSHRKVIQDMPVEIVPNEAWQKGMGSSLKVGVRHALKMAPSLRAILVMVCDQPHVSAVHLNALIQKFTQTGRSIASSYGNTVGVPALFDASLFQKLLILPDDQGAKKIIAEEYPLQIAFPEGIVDLDTEEDYNAFVKGNSGKK